MPVDNIWVFGESQDQRPVMVTLELLTKARDLGGSVSVFYAGAEAEGLADEFGKYGAGKVYMVDPGDTLPGAATAKAMAGVIESEKPDLIMFPSTYTGRDVCGALSVILDHPVISNGGSLKVEGDDVIVGTQIFGGQSIVETAFRCPAPHLALIRPKSFTAEPAESGASPEVVKVDLPDVGAQGQTKVLERHVEKSEGPKLEEAAIVVSGGRGLGAAENYKLVEDLAEVLKGAKGASRAIVDAGWVPYSHQVGQTGKVVKPKVYIALGISGAMQHMVGMKDSGHIIAVNKDAEAPIFGITSLGVVGDVHKVVPALIDALKKR